MRENGAATARYQVLKRTPNRARQVEKLKSRKTRKRETLDGLMTRHLSDGAEIKRFLTRTK